MQLKLLEVNKMNNVLEAKHINKYFKKPVLFHVLNNINFKVKKGEFVSIMGKSGCGKSTLLYILSTMDTEYEGELLLNNQLITGRSRHQLSHIRNKHIGYFVSHPPHLNQDDQVQQQGVRNKQTSRKNRINFRDSQIDIPGISKFYDSKKQSKP